MKKYLLILPLFSFLVSCQQNKPTGAETAGNTTDSTTILNDPKNRINLQISNFTEIDSSGILMLPLTTGESAKYSDRSSYKEIPYNSYWNIIFFNGKTNEYHLLTDKKILIREHHLKYGDDYRLHTELKVNYIFYTATIDDYDRDKKLTQQDPVYLFISDKEGNHFRQISPGGYNLRNWQYIKSLDKVILTAQKDSDNNKTFDDKDEIMAFEIIVDKESEPKEILSFDFKNELKILFDRDWKRLDD
mgnify:CR=1 FL=1